ncbi:MAG: tetratricopeptide repeat protein [Thermoanaerobaculia bacterium]
MLNHPAEVKGDGGSRRLSIAILGLAAMLVPPSCLRGTVDPFYSSLLERGVRNLEAGRAAEAARELEVACFGLLEDAAPLTGCYVQLGRALAATGDQAELRKTMNHIVNLQARFGTYSGMADAGLKAAFERALLEALAPGELTSFPLFAPRPQTSEVTQAEEPQSPRQRRRLLESLLEADPDDRAALWELAQLETSNGKPKRAAELLDRILANQPDDLPALCRRAGIAVARRECAPALAGLGPCAGLEEDDERAAFLLRCLVSTERHEDARSLLASLPEERRRAPKVARTAARIPPSDGSLESSGDLSEEPTTAMPSQVPAPVDSTEVAPESADTDAAQLALEGDAEAADLRSEESSELVATSVAEAPDSSRPRVDGPLEERLRGLRAEIEAARVRSDLAGPMSRASALAHELPDAPEVQHLVAEIAFRSADYSTAVAYFTRGGRPSADQHVLLFFLAVSLFETGDGEGAEQALREALPRIEASQPSEYVRSYIDRILGTPPE